MNEFEYKDYNPSNARIIINYKAKKGEKVKFDFPIKRTYKQSVWQSAFSNILNFWLLMHLQIAHYIILPIALIGLTIYLFINLSKIISSISTTGTTAALSELPIGAILGWLGALFYFFVTPYIITFILSRNKELLAKWMPKIGYYNSLLSNDLKEKVFVPNNIKDKKAIIPMFSNVYLDYKATEDFSKYLKKIEILEIPFYSKQLKGFIFRRTKKTYNEYTFRAVFHFSKKPRTGLLKVIFS